MYRAIIEIKREKCILLVLIKQILLFSLTVKKNVVIETLSDTVEGSVVPNLYRAFHNVLRDYTHL